MSRRRRDTAAFRLTQIGTVAARLYAERLAALDLTPPQSGLLHAIAAEPGRSQQELARHMGAPPTRLVALVDGLEELGLVERWRNPEDRRLYAVHLTAAGKDVVRRLGRIAREHDEAVLAGLEPDERAQLTDLLDRIAVDLDLVPGVHPGYRTLRAGDTGSPSSRPGPTDDEAG